MDPIDVRGVPMMPDGLQRLMQMLSFQRMQPQPQNDPFGAVPQMGAAPAAPQPGFGSALQNVMKAIQTQRAGAPAFPGTQPEAPAPLSPEEEAAASKPATFMDQRSGGLGPSMARVRTMVDEMKSKSGNVFDTSAPPLVAGGAGMPSAPSAAPEATPTAVTSLDGGGAVPIPHADPRKSEEVSSRGNVSTAAPVGDPMSLAPPSPIAAASAAPAAGGFKLPSSAFLLALAGGMAGAPSFGTAMRRGFSNAAGVAAQNETQQAQQQLTAQSQMGIINSLRAKGATNAEITAALSSPKMLDDISKKYFGATDQKAPTMRELKQPNGDVLQQEWNAQKGAWENIGGPVPGSKRDKSLSISDIEKLSAEGQKLAQVTNFHNTFKDQYGGYYTNTIGDAANTIARHAPWSSPDATERANWWQGYQMHKNEVRNKMFGSALTAQESAEWSKADIAPGMRPDVIKANLQRQQQILDTAVKRKAEAAVKAGYPAESVYAAFGVPMPGAKPAGGAVSGKTKSGITFSVEPDAAAQED